MTDLHTPKPCFFKSLLWIALILLLAHASDASWKVGLARVKITPTQPVVLLGYTNRSGPFKSVAHEIWAKAIVLEDASGNRGEIERCTTLRSAEASMARQMLNVLERGGELPTSYPAPITVWRFGDDLTLVALPAEPVADYVTLLREALGALGPRNLWIAGYNNGQRKGTHLIDLFRFASWVFLVIGGYVSTLDEWPLDSRIGHCHRGTLSSNTAESPSARFHSGVD